LTPSKQQANKRQLSTLVVRRDKKKTQTIKETSREKIR